MKKIFLALVAIAALSVFSARAQEQPSSPEDQEKKLLEYIDTPEPYDKAGAYAIQETFSKYVTRYTGDIENIIGFPFAKFIEELK